MASHSLVVSSFLKIAQPCASRSSETLDHAQASTREAIFIALTGLASVAVLMSLPLARHMLAYYGVPARPRTLRVLLSKPRRARQEWRPPVVSKSKKWSTGTFQDSTRRVAVRSRLAAIRHPTASLLNAEQARTARSDCRPDLQFESVCRQGQPPSHF